MVQFNLLPDVKVKYIKARRQKRRTMAISSIVGISAISLLALMMIYVYGIQKAQLVNLDSQIKETNEKLLTQSSRVDDINKVLTVQNQLKTLDTLHADKPITSRIYDYLSKMLPEAVTVNSINLQVESENSLVLQGSTTTLANVNKFVDTLKFTIYKESEESGSLPLFSSVVLSSFGKDVSGSSYVVTLTYDPRIFESDFDVKSVVVPTQTTTRSELGRPLFQTLEQSKQDTESGGE